MAASTVGPTASWDSLPTVLGVLSARSSCYSKADMRKVLVRVSPETDERIIDQVFLNFEAAQWDHTKFVAWLMKGPGAGSAPAGQSSRSLSNTGGERPEPTTAAATTQEKNRNGKGKGKDSKTCSSDGSAIASNSDLQHVLDRLANEDLNQGVSEGDMRKILLESLSGKTVGVSSSSGTPLLDPRAPGEQLPEALHAKEVHRILASFEEGHDGKWDPSAFVDWLKAMGNAGFPSRIRPHPRAAKRPQPDRECPADSSAHEEERVALASATLSSPSFEEVFKEECDKVDALIEKRVEATLEEVVRKREQDGEHLSETEKANLRQSLAERDTKSHPAWDAQDAWSGILGETLLTDLLEGFAPNYGCSKDKDIAFARALALRESPGSIYEKLDCQRTLQKLAKMIHEEAIKMSAATAPTGAELNDKFASGEGVITMDFGDMGDFSKGLEKRIGSPNPNLMPSMIRDHCKSCESKREWVTGNYGVATNSCQEFLLVIQESTEQCRGDSSGRLPLDWKTAALDLEAAKDPLPPRSDWPTEWPKETKNAHKGRRPSEQKFLEALLDKNDQLTAAGKNVLSLEEGIMLRLYTGPLFEKYNAVPRGGALGGCKNKYLESRFRALCCVQKDGKWVENRYATSIHVLTSGVVKLSMLSKATKVYRGLGGNLLPEPFWNPDEYDCKGGVEFGFMSTTRDQSVATQYAGDGEIKMVLEIETGSVDRGADLQALSQYPHEAELLFPPLTCLQVLATKSDRGVLFVKTRANVNLKNGTIDDVISKRHQVLMSMVEANSIEVDEMLRTSTWQEILGGKGPASSWVDDQLLEEFRQVLNRKTMAIMSEKATAYNDDSVFVAAVRDLVQLQASCRLQSSSLLREVANKANHTRLLDLAEEREALEVEKHPEVSLSFKANSDGGVGGLWLFEAMGFEKALDGFYYHSKNRKEYREGTELGMVPVATKGLELPGANWALLAINGARDLQLQARALQGQWRDGANMELKLEMCRPISRQDFSTAVKEALAQGVDGGHLTQLLLSNHRREELDLNDADLDDQQGSQLAEALSIVGEHLANLELLLLGGNKFRSKTTSGLAQALKVGALPKLRQLRCFKSPMGEDMEAMAELVAVLAQHCGCLQVLTLDNTSMGSLDSSSSDSTALSESFATSFKKLFLRLETLDLCPNEDLDSGMGFALAIGLAGAASAAAAAAEAARKSATMGSKHPDMEQGCPLEVCSAGLPLKILTLNSCPRLFAGVGKKAMQKLSGGLASCHVLEELFLSETGLASGACAGEALAEALPKCAKLRKLWLFNNPQLFEADPSGIAAFCRALAGLGDLEELHLVDTGLASGAGAGEALAEALPKCAKLRKLWLHSNPQLFETDPTGGTAVCRALTGLGDLEELCLNSTGLASGAGAGEALAEALPTCPKLRILRLYDNPQLFEADPRGSAALCGALASLGVLEELHLRETGLTSGAGTGEALAEALPKCAKLRQLMLFNNPQLFEADPTGSAAVCRALAGLGDLEELYLNSTGLASGAGAGEALAEALSRCTKLRELMLHGNPNLDEADRNCLRDFADARGREGRALEEFEIDSESKSAGQSEGENESGDESCSTVV